MKKALALLLVCAMALTACDHEQSSGDHPKQKPNANGGAHQPQAGGGANQPAPVQGDPSAHNTQPGEVDLHVEWASENKKTPACEWSMNAPGQGHPCEALHEGQQEEPGEDYFGLWEYTTTGKAGDVVWLSAQGNIGTKWIRCAVFWKGAYHTLTASGKRCGGTYTLS